MVARADSHGHDADTPTGARSSGLLAAWRRLFAHALRGPTAAVGALLSTLRRALAGTADARGPLAGATTLGSEAVAGLRAPYARLSDADATRHGRLMTAGIVAVIIGGLAAAAVTWSAGAGPASVGIAAAGAWAWAAVRYLLLAWTAPPSLQSGPVRAVWGVGAVPMMVAATPLLAAFAFVVGAWVTLRAAEGAGAERMQAVGMVVTAFGAQLAVVVASWILRAGIFFVL